MNKNAIKELQQKYKEKVYNYPIGVLAENVKTDKLHQFITSQEKEKITKLSDSLIVNGNQLYMDYHDGKYGVNTSPSRGADTFIPFQGKVGSVGSFTVTDGSHILSGSKKVEGTVLCAGVSEISGRYQGEGLSLSWSGDTISYSFNHNGDANYGDVTLTFYYCYI